MIGKKKPIEEKNYKLYYISSDDIEELGAIFICALRHSLKLKGRVPRLVFRYLKRHPELITPDCAKGLIRDLEIAVERPRKAWEKEHGASAFGEDAASDMWMELLAWLRVRKKEMEMHG